MPYKENMNKSKKAIMVEALMRILIMIFAVWVVFSIGKEIAQAIFGGDGGETALRSFENLAEEINTLAEGASKQALLSMDTGTAVIGFSKNSKEFRCYGCPQAFSSKPFYYSILKPSNDNCKDKPCICLCSEGFKANPLSGGESKISCDLFSFQTLSYDIAPKISLEGALKKRNIQLINYPYWDHGFFFVRIKDTETPLNGMTPPNTIKKITLFIEKKRINQETYIGVCPLQPCLQ